MNNNPVDVLQEIYRLYDAQLEAVDVACCKYCAECCTTNVTMTRLEGTLIAAVAGKNRIAELLSRGACEKMPRYQPILSTNAYVASCRTDAPLPDDPSGAHTGVCPFLKDSACTIYQIRPFGCRCMISTQKCSQNGYAEIDDLTLTFNTVFLQFIEHIDQKGFSGNMIDVLIHLSANAGRIPEGCRVTPNRPIPALMVPPRHRDRIAGVISRLNRLASHR